jgi:hypothetical protein
MELHTTQQQGLWRTSDSGAGGSSVGAGGSAASRAGDVASVSFVTHAVEGVSAHGPAMMECWLPTGAEALVQLLRSPHDCVSAVRQYSFAAQRHCCLGARRHCWKSKSPQPAQYTPTCCSSLDRIWLCTAHGPSVEFCAGTGRAASVKCAGLCPSLGPIMHTDQCSACDRAALQRFTHRGAAHGLRVGPHLSGAHGEAQVGLRLQPQVLRVVVPQPAAVRAAAGRQVCRLIQALVPAEARRQARELSKEVLADSLQQHTDGNS